MKRRAFLAGAVAFVARPVCAEEASGAVAIGGDRFELGEQEFHLADILAPSAYTLRGGTAPYFSEATAALRQFADGAALYIEDAAGKTRWGARVVRARRAGDDEWLQLRLVRAGAARVAPQTDDLEFIDGLLLAEAAARGSGKGLWRLQSYRVFSALKAGAAVGAFNLVEGTVVNAQKTRSRFYLNFGEDYREDFTATAPSSVYRRWLKDGLDLAAFEGERVRVRGFVADINGPSIELKHRRQIETVTV